MVSIFREAARIANTSDSLIDAIRQAVVFARKEKTVCDDPEFWCNAENFDFTQAAVRIADWTKDGLTEFRCDLEWQLLILDLGGTPEIFELYMPCGLDQVDPDRISPCFNQDIIYADDLLKGFPEKISSGSKTITPIALFFDGERLIMESIHDLDLPIWNDMYTGINGVNGNDLYHGTNGYFLWMVLASFVFLDTLRSMKFHAKLGMNQRLDILIGFQEQFYHFACIDGSGHEMI